MALHRYLLFVAASSLIFNHSVLGLFMRTSQAKLFPPDSDPPEETLELWMGKRGMKGTEEHITSAISCNPDDWRLDGSSGDGSNQLSLLVLALDCVRCQRQLVTSGAQLTSECVATLCDVTCRRTEDGKSCWARCEWRLAGDDNERTPQWTPEAYPSASEAEDDVYDTADDIDAHRLLESRQRFPPKRSAAWNPENSPVLQAEIPEDGYDDTRSQQKSAVNKRYRLGLYDCISSYCGKLSGPDRQLCIVNYCHRSSTLKM